MCVGVDTKRGGSRHSPGGVDWSPLPYCDCEDSSSRNQIVLVGIEGTLAVSIYIKTRQRQEEEKEFCVQLYGGILSTTAGG